MSITKFKKIWLLIMTVTVMVLIPSCRSWLPQETHVVILGLLICMAFLPTPYNKSCNLSDYDAIIEEAGANKASGTIIEEYRSH